MTFATCIKKARAQLTELDFDFERDLDGLEAAFNELTQQGYAPNEAAILAYNEVAEEAEAEHLALIDELKSYGAPDVQQTIRVGDLVRYDSAGKGTSGQETMVQGRVMRLYTTNHPKAEIFWKKGPASGRMNAYVSRLTKIEETTDQFDDPGTASIDLHLDEIEPAPLRDGEDLIIMACCDKKSAAPGQVAAIDRYEGAYYNVIKQTPASQRPPILILSARYGFISDQAKIPDYDQEMRAGRSMEMLGAAEIPAGLEELLAGRKFKNVIIAAGQRYRTIIDAFYSDFLDAEQITRTEGGIGEQRSQLKDWMSRNEVEPVDLFTEPEPAPTPSTPEEMFTQGQHGYWIGPERADVPDEWIIKYGDMENLAATATEEENAELKQFIDGLIARLEAIGETKQSAIFRQRNEFGYTLGFWTQDGQFKGSPHRKPDRKAMEMATEQLELDHAEKNDELPPIEFVPYEADEALRSIGRVDEKKPNHLEGIPEALAAASLAKFNEVHKTLADRGIDPRDERQVSRTGNNHALWEGKNSLMSLAWIANELDKMRAGKTFNRQRARSWAGEVIDELGMADQVSVDDVVPAHRDDRVAVRDEQQGNPAKNASSLLWSMGISKAVLEGDEFHKRIENGAYLDLVVESHDDGTGRKIYFTHYIEEGGDLVTDTEAVFHVEPGGQLRLKETAVRSLAGELRGYDAGFATVFTRNLINQGFGQAGKQLDPELAKELDDLVPKAESKWRSQARKIKAAELVKKAKKVGFTGTTKADAQAYIWRYVQEYRQSQLAKAPKEVTWRYMEYQGEDGALGWVVYFDVAPSHLVSGRAGLTDKGIKESMWATIKHFGGQAWKKPKVYSEDLGAEVLSGFVFRNWSQLSDFIEHDQGRRPTQPADRERYMTRYFEFPTTEELPVEQVEVAPEPVQTNSNPSPWNPNPRYKPEPRAVGDVVRVDKHMAPLAGVPADSEGPIVEFVRDENGEAAAHVDFGELGTKLVKLDYLRDPLPKKKVRKRKRKAGYGEKNTLVTKDEYEALTEQLKKDLGKLRSGIDPQMMLTAVRIGVYHMEAGARQFVDWSIEMLDALGDDIRPYLKDVYRAVQMTVAPVDSIPNEDLTPAEELDSPAIDQELAQREREEFEYASDTGTVTAPDRGEPNDAAATGTAVEGVNAETGSGARPTSGPATPAGGNQQGDSGVPGSLPLDDGLPGDRGLFDEPERPGADATAAGSAVTGGRDGGGEAGVQPEPGRRDLAPQDDANEPARRDVDKGAAQARANKIAVTLADEANIRKSLPYLTPEQQTDVLLAETRMQQGKTGMMFTNATGTGKTFTGLGIINRHRRLTGSDEILIVTTTQTKVADWIEDAGKLGLEGYRLEDKEDQGQGISVTTYANFRDNWEIHKRDWTLIVYDESHKIMEGQKSDNAMALNAHFAIGSHPDHLPTKAMFQVPLAKDLEMGRRRFVRENMRARLEDIGEIQEGESVSDVKESVKEPIRRALDREWHQENAAQYQDANEQAKALLPGLADKAGSTFVTFLSATPWPYHTNLHYANGYIFDYPGAGGSGYNAPDGREAFMISNLGYRMRYGKLTKPEAEVNQDLMERQLYERLKGEGAVSGRSADFGFDYSRDFVLVNPEIGQGLDEGINVLQQRTRDGQYLSKAKAEELGVPYFQYLPVAVRQDQRFSYLRLRQLMEGIKARELADRVRKHLALGRRVVVFHDYQQLNASHPFNVNNLSIAPRRNDSPAMTIAANEALREEIEIFNQVYGDLAELPLDNMKSVVEFMREEFGDQVAFFNGRVNDQQKKMGLRAFNNDASPVQILVVQRQSGKEGISAHDTTGQHPRALIDMGLPVHPTDALQTEGRTYRFGMQSNSVTEYPVLGVGFEQFLFARQAAERSRTAENLGMGNAARNIEVVYRDGYLNAAQMDPNADQGTGGLENDRRQDEITPFQAAISFYYSRQRNTRRRDQREGIDYFSTPEPLGLKMVEWAGLRPNERGMEPSAGHGAIARFFPDNTHNVFIEQSQQLGAEISLLGHGNFEQTDFMDFTTDSKFDVIVMNPPYGQGGATARDHVSKAMNHLKDGGRIVMLIPEGPAADKKFDDLIYGKDGEAEQLRERIKKAPKGADMKDARRRLRQLEEFYPIAEYGLPRVTFERAGTQVKTKILILDRYSNPDDVPAQRARRDIEAENINEFFETIEYLGTTERAEVTKAAPEAPTINNGDTKVTVANFEAELVPSYHAKKGIDIWVVKLGGARLPRETYLELKASAQDRGGYYSTYKGNGAIPGFVFEEEGAAQAFLQDYATVVSNYESIREQPGSYRVREETEPQDGDTFLYGPRFSKYQPKGMVKPTGFFKGPKVINTPEAALQTIAPFGEYGQEQFVSLITDKHDKPLAIIRHHIGDLSGAQVDMASVLPAVASIKGAAKVWWAHNHPSGSQNLSPQDYRLTEKLAEQTAGTGIMQQGMLLITPSGFGAWYDPDMHATLTQHSMPKQQPVENLQIPVMERFIEGREQAGPVIDSPESAIKIGKQLIGDRTGIMLLNNQHKVLGFQELDDAVMSNMRTQDLNTGAGLMWQSMLDTNAVAIIVVTKTPQAMGSPGENINNMAKALGIRMLDALIIDENGEWTSAEDTGRLGFSSGPWFAKRNQVHTKPEVGLKPDRVVEIADEFMRGLNIRQASGISVDVVETQGDAFPDAEVRAMFWGNSNRMLLIADNFANKREVIEAMRHELLAHYGLNLFTPKTKRMILQTIADSAKLPGLAGLFKEIRKDYPHLAGNELGIAEEVFARIVEPETQSAWQELFDNVMQVIVKALRELGLLKGIVTKPELRELGETIAQSIRERKSQQTFPDSGQPGSFNRERRAETALYSAVVKAIKDAKQDKATGQQWLSMIKKTPGVKAEELIWTGLDEYLRENTTTVLPKAALMAMAGVKAPRLKAIYGVPMMEEVDPRDIDYEWQESSMEQVDPSDEYLDDTAQDILDVERQVVEDRWHNMYDRAENEGYEPTDDDLLQVARLEAEDRYYQDGPDEFFEFSIVAHLGSGGEYIDLADMNYRGVYHTQDGTWELYDELGDRIPMQNARHKDDVMQAAEDNTRRYAEEEAVEMEKQQRLDQAPPGVNEFRLREQQFAEWALEGAQTHGYKEIQIIWENLPEESKHFSESHWDDEDVLMHVRVSDREIVMPGKEKPENTYTEPAMFVEEIQSDWHQKGRELGYETESNKEDLNALVLERSEVRKAQRDLFHEYSAQISETLENVRKVRDKYREMYDLAYAHQHDTTLDLHNSLGAIQRVANGGWETFGERVENMVSHLNAADDGQFIAQFNDAVPVWEAWDARMKPLALKFMELSTKINAIERGVPQAPLKKTWQESAFRWAVWEAARVGRRWIAWTPGEMQADRYNLARFVNRLELTPKGAGMVNITGYHSGNYREIDQDIEVDRLAEYVGEKIANQYKSGKGIEPVSEYQVIASNSKGEEWNKGNFNSFEEAERFMDGQRRFESGANAGAVTHRIDIIDAGYEALILEGDDLQIGGHGMNAFYDKILPSYAKKFGKKFGAKVEVRKMAYYDDSGHRATPIDVWAMPITEAMRETAVKDGFPMFSKRRNPNRRPRYTRPEGLEDRLFGREGQPRMEPEGNERERTSEKLLHKMHQTLDSFGSMGKLPGAKEYLKRRYLALGDISEINRQARRIYDALHLAGDNAHQVYEYLTNKDANPNEISDPLARKAAVQTKTALMVTGRKLVERGLLDETVYERNKGKYLPRLYMMHLLKDADIVRLSTGKKPSDLGYLKHRKDIPEEVRKLMLGEVFEPAFLASRAYGQQERDIAILDWLADLSENKDWVLQQSVMQWSWTDRKGETHTRRVTPFYLKEKANQVEQQLEHYAEEDKEFARELVKQMRDAANNALQEHQLESVPDGFKQMPNSPRFGTMRGLIVRKEIYDDIVGSMTMVTGENSVAEQILGNGGYATRFTQIWKSMKVAMNPPAQVRNFVSNGILLHLSGVPFVRVPQRMTQALKEIIAFYRGGKPAEYKHFSVARKYGVTESTFAAQELFRMERDLLKLESETAGKLISWTQFKLLWSTISDAASDVYQFSETVFKTAKIIDAIEREKMSESDAALEAQKWLFDYSLVTPSMRYLRNAPIGVPFLTFYMKVAPRLIETMVTAPWRFAPYLALPYAMAAMLEQMQDIDDDDVEALTLALPKWLQQRGHAYFLPMKDSQGRWFAADFGYFMPWAMWTEMFSQTAKGQPIEGLLGSGLLGGPVPDLIAAVLTNKDPFTGREIVNKFDSPSRQVADMMHYLYQLSAPTWLTSIGFTGHMHRALTGAVDKYGQPRSTVPQAALRLVGFNMYAVEPELSRNLNLRRDTFEIRQMTARRNALARDPNLTAEQREELMAEFNERIKKRVEKLQEYALKSRLTPAITGGISP